MKHLIIFILPLNINARITQRNAANDDDRAQVTVVVLGDDERCIGGWILSVTETLVTNYDAECFEVAFLLDCSMVAGKGAPRYVTVLIVPLVVVCLQ